MEQFINTAREIIETAETAMQMHQRLVGLALDWKGTFKLNPLGVGREVAVNDSHDIVVIGAGRVVAYFYKPGTQLPGLNGLLIDAKINKAEQLGKEDTVKIGIGIYTPSIHLDGKNTMSDMLFTTTNDLTEIRGLLEFF